LIEPRRDQKRPSDAFVAECEPHVGNRARSHEGPLDQGCERGEAAPNCEIEASEHGRRCEDPAPLAPAARESCRRCSPCETAAGSFSNALGNGGFSKMKSGVIVYLGLNLIDPSSVDLTDVSSLQAHGGEL
jgi:hypothetical protein